MQVNITVDAPAEPLQTALFAAVRSWPAMLFLEAIDELTPAPRAHADFSRLCGLRGLIQALRRRCVGATVGAIADTDSMEDPTVATVRPVTWDARPGCRP